MPTLKPRKLHESATDNIAWLSRDCSLDILFRKEQRSQPMRYAAPKCALFLSLVTSLCLCQQLSLRMANQDVIDMVALGLSDDVIIAKIHTVDSTNFDTSVKGLRALKVGKVSDAVISTMI